MMEVKQRYVIKFLDTKKFNLSGIGAELASVYGEQAYAKKAVEYWAHQVKLAKTVMEDDVKADCPPLDDIDERIPVCLSHKSF
jgi:hypothetical protein